MKGPSVGFVNDAAERRGGNIMDNGRVRLETSDGIATMTFDRQGKRNAMTWAMYEEMADQLAAVKADPKVRVLLLRGAGDEAFVAGTDIGQFLEFETGADGVDYTRKLERPFEALASLEIPTIAVCRGAVVGGGLAIAITCDLRLSADDARFALPVARSLGNLPSAAFLTRLVSLVGPGRVKELVFTARSWTAAEARAMGLVTEMHAAEELDARVAALSSQLATFAPLTLAGVKEIARRIVEPTTPDSDDLVERVYGSRDFAEGVESFVEKRAPRFIGE